MHRTCNHELFGMANLCSRPISANDNMITNKAFKKDILLRTSCIRILPIRVFLFVNRHWDGKVAINKAHL